MIHNKTDICFTIFTEPNIAGMNLRTPNDSAIHGNLFNRRLNYIAYTIPASQQRQDIFDMASFLAKLRSARRRRIFIVFLHVSTDPARAAALTDLNCVGIVKRKGATFLAHNGFHVFY